MKTKFAYRAICATCYTCCVSGRSTSKADANRAATSHMNAYGHSVHIACEEIVPAVRRPAGPRHTCDTPGASRCVACRG